MGEERWRASITHSRSHSLTHARHPQHTRVTLHGRRRSSWLNASHVDAPSCSDPLDDPLVEPLADPLTMGTDESARLRVAMKVLTWPECEVAETASTACMRSSLICMGDDRGG